MAERNLTTQRWLYPAAYAGLTATFMLLAVVPLDVTAGRIPGPDLLLCITFAWVLRRPQHLPTPLVAAVFLMADMLFMRPPGLWTALVVMGVEFLRRRERFTREQPFPLEWAMVAGVILAVTLANRLVLAAFLVPQPALGAVLVQFIATVLCYPVIVLISRYVFGVRKMTPSQTDAHGRPR